MKKAIITLVVATALAPAIAQAQSSVTLYGLMDQGYFHINNASSAGNKSGVAAAVYSPRWGVKGTEDLGNGLKASFFLEQRIFADDGAIDGVLFKGGSNLSLSGGFGSVTLGRQVDPFYVAYVGGDVRGSINTGSGLQPYLRAVVGAGGSNIAPLWVDNAVSYTTPSLGGFKATAYYSFGEVADNISSGKQQGLTASFANGPFLANVGTVVHYGSSGATANIKNGKANTISGGYKFGAGEIRLSWTGTEDPSTSSTKKYTIASISGKFSITSNVVLSAGYYRLKDKNNLLKTASLTGAQVDYLLSKRSVLYAVYGHSNHADTVQAVHAGGTGLSATTAGNAGGQTMFAVGLRHSF